MQNDGGSGLGEFRTSDDALVGFRQSAIGLKYFEFLSIISCEKAINSPFFPYSFINQFKSYNKMTRYEFLKSMGFTGAALMAALTSCVKPEDTYVPVTRIDLNTTPITPTVPVIPATPTTNISSITNPILRIDLATSSIKTVGAYVIQSNIVVAQVSVGAYAAVTNLCSHEPKRQVVFSQGEFYCTAHGARFDLNGGALNSTARGGITAYKVATDGKTLVVY
jgi:nitrite reductase/ring-hydroxylating ferredoxin subunit